MPNATAWRRAGRRSTGVTWRPLTSDPEVWTTFQIMTEEQAVDPDWWQRTDANAMIGRLRMSNGLRLLVVSATMRGFDGSVSGQSMSPHAETLRELAKQGHAGAILLGRNDDGSVWLLDLPRTAIRVPTEANTSNGLG